MDITHTSWSDIFKTIVLNHGEKGLMVVIALISFVIGCCVTFLYLTKIKYKLNDHKLFLAEEKRENAEKELNKANKKIKELEKKNKHIESKLKKYSDYMYAKQAVKPDPEDVSLKEFTNNKH